MARIPREDYHAQNRVFSRGKIIVYCACKTTALDITSGALKETLADEVFAQHLREVGRTFNAA